MDPIKIEHFRNLVSLSAVDGRIAEEEREVLARIAGANGIPAERLDIMLKRAAEYVYLIPQNHQEREKQLSDMIELAFADGEFAQAEYELIAVVAAKLGFSGEDFRAIIRRYSAD